MILPEEFDRCAPAKAALTALEEGLTAGPRCLLHIADIDRQIREENARHERIIADLESNRFDAIELAVELGHVEEAHPWGVYRIETKTIPGRRSIDADKFTQLFPDLCEVVRKAPTLAKAEKALSPRSLALVVKRGEDKTERAITFEPAPLPFEVSEP